MCFFRFFLENNLMLFCIAFSKSCFGSHEEQKNTTKTVSFSLMQICIRNHAILHYDLFLFSQRLTVD